MMKTHGNVLAAALLLGGCAEATDKGAAPQRLYRGYAAFTLKLGQSDNAEAVKLIPSSDLALLSSSKAKKATLVRIDGETLVELRSRALFADDPSESELTNVEVGPAGEWAVFTRTLETRDAAGKQTSCGGEVVFVDITDSAAFGTVLQRVTVGPMPDSVDVSSDGRWVVVANERDSAWGGKCEVAGVSPSISIIDVTNGVGLAHERQRVTMPPDATDGREPESIVFSRDDDLVVCTLQDSHEVALLRLSALAGLSALSSQDLQVVRLPQNSLGQDPWPDNIVAFADQSGAEYFAIAGEWNDTLIVIDGTGAVVANVDIDARDMPSDLPRDASGEAPPFRPDSLTKFQVDGHSYLAASLKHAGAVGIWDVSAADAPTFAEVIKIGKEDAGTPTTASTVGGEGVAASADGSAIVCANEGEGSLSLILPRP